MNMSTLGGTPEHAGTTAHSGKRPTASDLACFVGEPNKARA